MPDQQSPGSSPGGVTEYWLVTIRRSWSDIQTAGYSTTLVSGSLVEYAALLKAESSDIYGSALIVGAWPISKEAFDAYEEMFS